MQSPPAPIVSRVASPRRSLPVLSCLKPKSCSSNQCQLPFCSIGPYEKVKESLWDELLAWAERNALAKPWTLLGIAHDAPGITPASKLRFDAGLFAASGLPHSPRIGKQALPEGFYALTTCVGPYTKLPLAYHEIFGRIQRMKGVTALGVPCIEIYHTNRVVADLAVKHTDIYVPVMTRPGIGMRRVFKSLATSNS